MATAERLIPRGHGPQHRAKTVFVKILDWAIADEGQHVVVKRAYELRIAIRTLNPITYVDLEQIGYNALLDAFLGLFCKGGENCLLG